MSSELRLKKLRGSGGHIMAQVSDQQQAKGNLGGPDLFLAPIGRIDSGKISKHFCNTCEKEFEGGPKIDFENPNEEVAENLVLVEKGQYVCNACGSTIAEYREFKKSDEGQDIGLAKPAGDRGVEPAPRAAAPEPSPPPEPAPQQQQQQQQQEPTVRQDAPAVPESHPVNAIDGMTVFDENARRLGTAKQVGVDSANTVVLIIAQDDGSNASVPWSRVKTVGEVVLLGSPPDAPQRAADEPGKCPGCGFSNKADAKFCEECGGKLASA